MPAKTPPIGLRWPQDLFDLYQAKAAELHAADPEGKHDIATLARRALRQYADQQGWTFERYPVKTQKPPE